jgi:hypothetical protein
VRPCLSEDALNRVLAELGTPAERAHLAVCPACAVRFRRMTVELGAIRQVLVATPEPGAESTERRPRWRMPAAVVAAAVMVAALVWTEVALWRGLVPSLTPSAVEEAQAEQVALALENLSATLFSVSGEPTAAFAESVGLPPEGDELDPACDAPEELTALECAGAFGAGGSGAWAMDQDLLDEDDTDPDLD